MLALGQNVSFKRSNGQTQVGKINFIEGDFLIVQWTSRDGKTIGQKTIFKNDVHLISSDEYQIKSNKFKLICLIICVFFGFVFFLDYYFSLKQVC